MAHVRHTAEHEAARAEDPPAAAVLSGVTKRFGDRLANDSVSFSIPQGRVLALVGENGAGKTTAMNVLAGVYVPDAGRVLVAGRELPLGSPRAAVEAGVGMVPQHPRLVETLTAAENVSLALDRGRLLQPRRLPSIVDEFRERLRFAVQLDAKVWQLSLAERQQVEILRTLATGATILILDEPSAVLSTLETEQLFAQVTALKDMGRSVVLITHKLNEVQGVADDLVVMRGGKVVHAGPVGQTDVEELASLVVGTRSRAPVTRPARPPGAAVLTLSGVRVRDEVGRVAIEVPSLRISRGELVVLLGVTGNGQSELLEAIGGLRRPEAGVITVPRRWGRRDFAYIPEDRMGVGLAPGLALADNAVLGRQWFPPFGRWMRRRAVRRHASDVVSRFDVQGNLRAPVSQLSGGNLQRLLLGREVADAAELLVAAFPTRGLDIGSARRIRRVLVEMADAGCAVLVASEELEESLEIATRVLVVSGGRLVADLPVAEADLAVLGRLLTTGSAV